MKNLLDPEINRHRLRTQAVVDIYGNVGNATCGVFIFASCVDRRQLFVVASSDFGWEHVSVSRKNRTPTWGEMDQIKRLFWEDEEAVMQLHPPRSSWINFSTNCLHLWRPTEAAIPLPPPIFVGPVKSVPSEARDDSV